MMSNKTPSIEDEAGQGLSQNILAQAELVSEDESCEAATLDEHEEYDEVEMPLLVYRTIRQGKGSRVV